MKTLVLCIFLFTVLGCAAQINRVMESWMGHQYNELIARWGPPQQILDDGQGGKIIIYGQSRQWATPGYATTYTTGSATAHNYGYNVDVYGAAQSQTMYTPPQTHSYTAYRMFWVNRNGYIYRWAWKGL